MSFRLAAGETEANKKEVKLSPEKIEAIENAFLKAILKEAGEEWQGRTLWFEAGGYAKWSKASSQ